MIHPARTITYAGLLVGLLLAAACSREEVTHFRVPKQARPPSGATPAGMGMGDPSAAADLPAPPRTGGLRWTLPAGWKESAGGQMRLATLRPPVAGRIDASVVVLSGTGGGELANVNRWRGQIGLPPIDDAALGKARKIVKSPAGRLHVYDFTSDGDPKSRVVAGLASAKGDTWFVKLNGDAAAVDAARADFMQLLGSLRFE